MRRGWCSVFLSGVLLLGARAAQAQTPYEPNIDMQTFRPAPGPYNFLTVAGSRVEGRTAPSFGAWANWGYQPLTVYNAQCPNSADDTGCTRGAVRSRPIEHQATLNLLAGVTLFNRLFLSVDIPLTLESGDAVDATTLRPVSGPGGVGQSQTHGGLGDPRIEARVRLAGHGLTGAGLAASVWGTIPSGRFTGAGDHFTAESNVTLGGRLIADYRVGRIAVAANLGAVWRPETLTLLSTSVGSRLTWGAAFGFDISPRLAVIAEAFGSSNFSSASSSQNHTVEGDLAARYTLGDVNLTAGAGTGFLRGAGSPLARVFLGFGWAPYRVDRDNDGVNDNHDRCPTEPEDHDGYEDGDGCPDPDNDGDGVPDVTDRCPNAAEDHDNFQDQDGCPDPDNDNDGVPDGYDTCPRDPEDRDGDHDEDGCPDDDRDRDGVRDEQDRCPTEPEDTDGFEDEDGCPDPDNDHDGVLDGEDQCSEQPAGRHPDPARPGCPLAQADRDHDGVADAQDRCPDQPGNVNGTATTDGCPPAAPSTLATVVGDQIQITEQINFRTNSDRIVGRTSFDVLDAVAGVLRAHANITHVEVQGHTDNRGRASRNRALSQRRADAVRRYLIEHGVSAERLTARGFGPDQPLESNSTSAGRARNRRVEFHFTPTTAPAPAPAP